MKERPTRKALAVRSRSVAAEERENAIAFLKSERYSRMIAEDDQFFIAEIAKEIVAAVRLAREEGVLVLRGMRVRGDVQREGVGTQLLHRLVLAIRSEACYCIPYRWLISFYAQAGFREILSEEAPAFLADRRAHYASEGLDVVLMRRPSE